MSASDTISTKRNGCKHTILIPLLMAGFIIVFLLAMSSESTQYAISAASFEPSNDAFFRLEGQLKFYQPQSMSAQLCDKDVCIPCLLPENFIFQPEKHVIAEGRWVNDAFHISRILTRCDHGSK